MGLQFLTQLKKTLSPLHQAAKDGDLAKVKQLLLVAKFGRTNVNCGDKSYSRHPALFEAAHYGHLEIVKLLTKCSRAATVVRLRDRSGQTVLHVAAMTGQTEVIKYLIENVAGVDKLTGKRDCYECTPLHYAAYFAHAGTMRFLMSRGADLYATNPRVATPLQLLAKAAGRPEYKVKDMLFMKYAGPNGSRGRSIALSSKAPAKKLLKLGHNKKRGFKSHRVQI
jgi:ankyrin repeat protein